MPVCLLLFLEALASPGSELLHPLNNSMSPKSEAARCPPALMFCQYGHRTNAVMQGDMRTQERKVLGKVWVQTLALTLLPAPY